MALSESEKADLIRRIPALESPCEECGGKGIFGTGPNTYLCLSCEGTGAVLTAFGETIYDFIEHTIQRRRVRGDRAFQDLNL